MTKRLRNIKPLTDHERTMLTLEVNYQEAVGDGYTGSFTKYKRLKGVKNSNIMKSKRYSNKMKSKAGMSNKAKPKPQPKARSKR